MKSSSTCARRGARTHPAGWSGERHLSLPDASVVRRLRRAERTQSGWWSRTNRSMGPDRFRRCWVCCGICETSSDWMSHCGFLLAFLSIWKVKCDGEEKRASFPPAQSTMRVSLAVPALSTALLSSASLYHHVWQTYSVTLATRGDNGGDSHYSIVN